MVKKCQQYEECDVNNPGIATHECESCGTLYCKKCAFLNNYECDCEIPPELIPIKKEAKNVPNK